MAPALDPKGEHIEQLLKDIKNIPPITECAKVF